jgi:uncharacterized protein (TIGR00251 family)
MSDAPELVRGTDGGVLVAVWVVPGSSRPGIDGIHDGRLRVRVAAPPQGGRANREAAALVAEACGGRRGTVVAGAAHRRKTIEVPGIDPAQAGTGLRARGIRL